MRPVVRRRIGLAITLVAVAGSVVYWNQPRSKEAVRRQFADALANSDWGRLYSLGAPEEIKHLGITRSQFESLCSNIMSQAAVKKVRLTWGRETGVRETDRIQLIEFPCAARDSNCQDVVFLYKGKRDWHSGLGSIPYILLQAGTDDDLGKYGIFADALTAAGIDEWRNIGDKSIVNVDRLRRVAAGELPAKSMHKFSP